jgi:hypothetical protein
MGIFDGIKNFFGGGDDEDRTTTTVNKPPEALLKFANNIWDRAGSVYDKRPGFRSMGGRTKGALRDIWGTSQRTNPMLNPAIKSTQSIMNGTSNIWNGGQSTGRIASGKAAVDPTQFNDVFRAGGGVNGSSLNKGPYASIANGQSRIDPTGFNDVLRAGGGVNGSGLNKGIFASVANGDMVGSNPYREAAIAKAMDDTADRVKASMTASGRYGSGYFGKGMGEALGGVATNARMAGYDTDMGFALNSATARESANQGRIGLGLDAEQRGVNTRFGNLSNIMQTNQAQEGADFARMGMGIDAAQRGVNTRFQNQNQRLAATGLRADIAGQNIDNRLDATSLAPMLQNLRYDDATRGMLAGKEFDANNLGRDNYQWDQLGKLAGFSGVLGGGYGTQTQIAPPANPWMNLAALGMGAANIWGM